MWLRVGLAPLLTSPAPLLTSPAPLLTPAAPLFPAPLQQKLEGFPKDTSCTSPDVLGLQHLSWPLLQSSPAPLLTSPAPLLHLSWPLLSLSDPCTSPAEVRRLSERHLANHLKTNAKLCKAFLCFYVKLSDVVTCWAWPHAPLLHLSWPLLHLSLLHLSSRS